MVPQDLDNTSLENNGYFIKKAMEIWLVTDSIIATEPDTSDVEKTAPPGELEFFSRSSQKNISNFSMFF